MTKKTKQKTWWQKKLMAKKHKKNLMAKRDQELSSPLASKLVAPGFCSFYSLGCVTCIPLLLCVQLILPTVTLVYLGVISLTNERGQPSELERSKPSISTITSPITSSRLYRSKDKTTKCSVRIWGERVLEKKPITLWFASLKEKLNLWHALHLSDPFDIRDQNQHSSMEAH